MAQDITLLGANYSAVPAVELPKTGGGTASFTDITDTTAAAADVAQGKYFYNAAGVRTEGTASGGGTDYLELLLLDTLTEYTNNNVTNIKQYAFQSLNSIEQVSFPNVTTLGQYAFDSCSNLERVEIPKVVEPSSCSFRNCVSLTYYDFSQVVRINQQECFRNTGFSGVYVTNCTVGAFTSGQFRDCANLVYARFPNHNTSNAVRADTFRDCPLLKLVDLGGANNFLNGNVFNGCASLEILILRRTANIAKLGNVNNFTGCGTGDPVKIYVPSSLKSAYESGTNWVTLKNNNTIQFYSLEGSPYEQTDFAYMGIP